MCYYITVAFPKTTAKTILTSLPKGLDSMLVTNPDICKLLPKDYESFAIITEELCSCGLYSPIKPDDKDKEREALRRKYTKKGWSENKIQRALDDHEKNMKTRLAGFRDDFLSWLTTLPAKSGASLFLIVHMYSGDIQTEELDIRRDKIKAAAIQSLQERFTEDVLVEIMN